MKQLKRGGRSGSEQSGHDSGGLRSEGFWSGAVDCLGPYGPAAHFYFITLMISGSRNQLKRVITIMLTMFITKPAFSISLRRT